MDPVMTHPTEGESWKMWVTEAGSISLSCAGVNSSKAGSQVLRLRHTGTFFCDSTTAQSFPRIPTDMIFAAVIALKAYSGKDR